MIIFIVPFICLQCWQSTITSQPILIASTNVACRAIPKSSFKQHIHTCKDSNVAEVWFQISYSRLLLLLLGKRDQKALILKSALGIHFFIFRKWNTEMHWFWGFNPWMCSYSEVMGSRRQPRERKLTETKGKQQNRRT